MTDEGSKIVLIWAVKKWKEKGAWKSVLTTLVEIKIATTLFFFFLKLHFRFWGTCEEHVWLLHRYTRGSVIFCLPPHHLYLAFLPMLSLPNSPPPAVLPVSPDRPQCVMLPSLCPCVLIVQHLPMNENMRCLIFCSCVSLLRIMVSRFIHVPTKDRNSSFLMAA